MNTEKAAIVAVDTATTAVTATIAAKAVAITTDDGQK